MNALLRLYITGDWPGRTTECEWVLCDAKGQLLQRGSSEPRHWPAAENCELVLSADQFLALEVKLPKGSTGGALGAARAGNLLAYALEERLIGDVENEHFVTGRMSPNGQTPVWIVGRGRLRALLAALQQIGRSPRRVLSELQFVPLVSRRWSAGLRAQGGFIRMGSETGFAFDVAGTGPPVAVGLALQASRKAGTAPDSIDVYCAQGVDIDAMAWQTALGIPVHRAGEYSWHAGSAAQARNVLVGEFATLGERSAAVTAFRPALTLGVLALMMYAVFSVGEWIWLDRHASNLRTEAIEVFRATFPQVQAIVDPSLQLQRLYDQLKRERGQLGESDFLPLVAAVSEALPGEANYRNMSYEDGRLELTLALPDVSAAERLRDALSRRGLTPLLRESRPAGAGFEVSFSVRRGP